MLLCVHKQAVNTVEAIWTKMPSEVDEKQYTEFYQAYTYYNQHHSIVMILLHYVYATPIAQRHCYTTILRC
jgi:HSP90 family molecular chaperone